MSNVWVRQTGNLKPVYGECTKINQTSHSQQPKELSESCTVLSFCYQQQTHLTSIGPCLPKLNWATETFGKPLTPAQRQMNDIQTSQERRTTPQSFCVFSVHLPRTENILGPPLALITGPSPTSKQLTNRRAPHSTTPSPANLPECTAAISNNSHCLEPWTATKKCPLPRTLNPVQTNPTLRVSCTQP